MTTSESFGEAMADYLWRKHREEGEMRDKEFVQWSRKLRETDAYRAATPLERLWMAWAESRRQRDAELSEPLPCGHPKACEYTQEMFRRLQDALIDGAHNPEGLQEYWANMVGKCLACAAARKAAERAVEATMQACKEEMFRLAIAEDGDWIEQNLETLDLQLIVERAVKGDQ